MTGKWPHFSTPKRRLSQRAFSFGLSGAARGGGVGRGKCPKMGLKLRPLLQLESFLIGWKREMPENGIETLAKIRH